jgi:hypothetical protein
VARVWREHDLKPWQTETFNFSTDPQLEAKVRDVVGLYLDPPDKAVVLCLAEKSQIQALERTQPIRPLGPGRPERHTHDDLGHGTTTLFAALEVGVADLVAAIGRFVDAWNQRCQPFCWVRDADQILAGLKRPPSSGTDRQQRHRHGTATPG